MEFIPSILMIAAVVIVVVILIKVLSAPIRWIFKLLINAALGFVILFVLNFFGGFIGLTLTINLISALLVGILGIPGVILLILYALFF